MIMKIGAARLPEHWQATADELAAGYPCDRLAKADVRALTKSGRHRSFGVGHLPLAVSVASGPV
jgi:hypothetical protein